MKTIKVLFHTVLLMPTALGVRIHWVTVSNTCTAASCGPYQLGAGVSCYFSKGITIIVITCVYSMTIYNVNYIYRTGTVPRTPTNVQITAIDQHSFQVSWSAPDMSNCADVDSYNITCYGYDHFYSTTEVPGHSLNATIVHDLDINENYYSGLFLCLHC